MNTTWIVVADASRARIFRADTPSGPLTEIETLAHPASRQHEGDLVSDRSGQDLDPNTGGHNMGRGKEWKQEEIRHFAKEVCRHLEQEHNKGSYAKLYLMAAPAFLGELRQHLAKPVHAAVAGEIDKDLTTGDDAQIRAHLPEYL
jgi:protein required for attachment to host cells